MTKSVGVRVCSHEFDLSASWMSSLTPYWISKAYHFCLSLLLLIRVTAWTPTLCFGFPFPEGPLQMAHICPQVYWACCYSAGLVALVLAQANFYITLCKLASCNTHPPAWVLSFFRCRSQQDLRPKQILDSAFSSTVCLISPGGSRDGSFASLCCVCSL